eukprot:9177218-Lingulodinium_polyedra.AAC.1
MFVFQRARRVSCDPGRPLALRRGPRCGHRRGLARLRVARGADLRGSRFAACHPAPGPCGARPRRPPPRDPHGARLFSHNSGRA